MKEINFRCCGCGTIWPDGSIRHCDCPTDVLYVRGIKNLNKIKSEWLKEQTRPIVLPWWRRSIAALLRRLALWIEG